MTYAIGSEDYVRHYLSGTYVPGEELARVIFRQEYQQGQLEVTRMNLDPADEAGWTALHAEFARLLDDIEKTPYPKGMQSRADELTFEVGLSLEAVKAHREGRAMTDKFSVRNQQHQWVGGEMETMTKPAEPRSWGPEGTTAG